MKARLFAASAVCVALLSASVLVTAQEKGKGDEDKDVKVRRASVLTGMVVRDKEGDYAGKINDMVVNAQTGEIIYFAVQSGDTLGFGGKLHAVGPNALKFTTGQATGNEIFAINIDAKELENMQGFDSNNWPKEPKTGAGPGKEGGLKDKVKEGAQDVKEAAGGKEGKDSVITRTSAINGMDVRNPQNEDLGDVYDLGININNWRIHYAAVSHGGTAGVGGKLYAVDWKALRLTSSPKRATDRYFELNATKETFQNARGFVSTDTWPVTPDPTFKAGGAGAGKDGK